MRKLALVLVVAGLLALAQAGWAGDLSHTWYADIYAVDVYTYGSQGYPILTTGASFTTQSGDYGPFHVWGGSPDYGHQRYISVPTDAYGVSPDQSLILPLGGGISRHASLAYLSLSVETNYEADQMFLELWHNRLDGTADLVWAQSKSGMQPLGVHVAYDDTWENGYFFKVNVVPEPTSLATLLAFFPLLATVRRKQR